MRSDATSFLAALPAVSARTLLLDLLTIDARPTYSLGQLVRAGEALGIGAGAIRTALSRLKAENRVTVFGRGEYAMGPGGLALKVHLQGWRELCHPPLTWRGGWLMVVTGAADRADRSLWRKTTRALRLEGFAEPERGIWVRPDNRPGRADACRDRITRLGADRKLLLVAASAASSEWDQRFRKAWDVAAMNRRYARLAEVVEHSCRRLPELPAAMAAREGLLLGRIVVREMIFDPRLPSEICDPAALRQLVDRTIRYEEAAQQAWNRYLVPLSDREGERFPATDPATQ